MILLFMTLLLAFLIAVILSPLFIPFLRRMKFGQYIREEGPKSHQKKAGTPTMGGVVIVISAALAAIYESLSHQLMSTEIGLLLFLTVAYGLIGFLDDFIKVVMKRNLGLTSKQKLFAQIVVAIIFDSVIYHLKLSTQLTIPGTHIEIPLSWGYMILVVIMLLGTSNGTNLTDGMDGLLTGTATVAFAAFAIIAYYQNQFDITLFCMAMTGALLGFLVFNAHPAKVFMGDTGSLAIGGALAGVSILTKSEILLIVIGGIFVIETLSVMIQVASFKTTGKRVFKMSPLHHHYELSGWSEWRIVSTFWVVGLLFAVIGIYTKVWL
ncbi:phospho-N-acetylmuramoyl-pentapeptide-transferase [Pullulanibacillus sp. KACC 23026]|uniref:phospho-N-acetylmuramoyl-pentapeptide- transferase n=1 Tax=Pullulanibacillus sp. KACC 23026 TaxID=3028315 RepID=UPI0023AEB64E|nr:phospho-N-acetylmuramoyl-pentapeptide-transferase [Pullulanibacillus sp. KACC 23026]WEG15005.1 phospho-N-acetylmuramoyl-pentapeptide-transferase [Pullulanibacillus sp. KACC 23026]